MDMAPYLLDANVFIEAANHYYAFDIAPGFWQGLIDHVGNGGIHSIDRVKEELLRGNDELADWVDTYFAHAFYSSSEQDVINSYGTVMNWVQSQTQLFDCAKSEFADCADGWVTAFAIAKGCMVVTHETPAPYSKKKVKIPDVCHAFGVQYVSPYEMLRNLGVRLVR